MIQVRHDTGQGGLKLPSHKIDGFSCGSLPFGVQSPEVFSL